MKNRRENKARLREYRLAVGRRVTAAMQDMGMSDDLLAVLCGVETEHIRRLKRGARGYVHGKLVRLVTQALGVDVSELEGTPPDFTE